MNYIIKTENMTVLLKKDEKIENVINNLEEDFSDEEFIEKFKELYPVDWNKINNTYNKHLRKAKPGRPIVMPKPDQYLKNALNILKNKTDN